MDWEALKPVIRTALQRLRDGPDAPAATGVPAAGGKKGRPAPKKAGVKTGAAAAAGKLEGGGTGGGDAAQKAAADMRNRALSEHPPPAQDALPGGGATSAAAGGPDMMALLAGDSKTSASGVPLSSYSCLHDDGTAQHRLCVFRNIVIFQGKLYFVAGAWRWREGGLPSLRALSA